MISVLGDVGGNQSLDFGILTTVIFAASCFLVISLLQHASEANGILRSGWLIAALLAVGAGGGAAHYLATLIPAQGWPGGENLTNLTSSIIVVGSAGIAGWAAGILRIDRNLIIAAALPSAITIAPMHLAVMAYPRFQGQLMWLAVTMAASTALAAVGGACGLWIGKSGRAVGFRVAGTVALTASTYLHHAIALYATSIRVGAEPNKPVLSASFDWTVGMTVLLSLLIFTLILMGTWFEIRDIRRSRHKDERLRGLAEATLDGLVVCDGTQIVHANQNFSVLAGSCEETVRTSEFSRWIPDVAVVDLMRAHPNVPVETNLVRSDGRCIEVELVQQTIDVDGKAHSVIGIRHLSPRRDTGQQLQIALQHDALTGLSNRARLNIVLQEMFALEAASRQPFAVYSIDIDRFKHVNDVFGNGYGDQLLVGFAQRLRKTVGSDHFIARIGGDEFVVVQPNLAAIDDTGRLAICLASIVAEPFVLGSVTIKATASIGVAVAPKDGANPEQILKSADQAMQQAKRTRNSVKTFAPEMDESFSDRVHLELILANAILNDRFVLHYQPLFDVASGALIGFEALIRMIDDHGRLVPPASFIPIAEDMGLLGEIGAWALKEACVNAAKWPEQLTIAVNLSATQFGDGSLAHLVSSTIHDSGLAASRLELEITESLLLEDSDSIMAELRALKDTGAKIVMDDFGTGYSSLSYLWKFPFDKLKVDRSFMTGFDGTGERVKTVLRTVIGLGRELNMRVTVEGVETDEQAAFLKSVNGDQVQGYLYGVPLTSADVSIFLEESFSNARQRQA
jgi:diguanylate cyclase (GGDEF)-like protein